MFALNSKPSFLGVFSRIFVPEIPAAHLAAFVVFGVDIPHGENLRPFAVRIECVDPSGQQIFEMKGATNPSLLGPESQVAISHQIVQLPPFPLPKIGVYNVRVYLDSDASPSGHVAFEVVHAPVQLAIQQA
jgi:hypothetical protein